MTHDLASFLTARLDEHQREIAPPPIGPHGEWRLADIDAKRRIIDLHEARVRAVGLGLSSELLMVLRLLALPYADHPDYDEAWRT